jgi:hypothetical protein
MPQTAFIVFPGSLGAWLSIFMMISMYAARIPAVFYHYRVSRS